MCPTPQFTLTMDGTQQHLNRGYCKYFFDCMIVNPELSTWSVRNDGLGIICSLYILLLGMMDWYGSGRVNQMWII